MNDRALQLVARRKATNPMLLPESIPGLNASAYRAVALEHRIQETTVLLGAPGESVTKDR